MDELSKELQQSKEELGEMRRHCQNIETQLKISQEANDDFADQLLNEREEKQKLVEKVSAIEKVRKGERETERGEVGREREREGGGEVGRERDRDRERGSRERERERERVLCVCACL